MVRIVSVASSLKGVTVAPCSLVPVLVLGMRLLHGLSSCHSQVVRLLVQKSQQNGCISSGLQFHRCTGMQIDSFSPWRLSSVLAASVSKGSSLRIP